MTCHRSPLFRTVAAALLGTAVISPSVAGDAVNPIVVTTTGDTMDAFDQQCSLREAIVNANTNTAFSPVVDECAAGSGSATDVIVLASGAVYLLTRAGAGDDAGDLDIVDDPALPEELADLRIEITGGLTYATIQQQVAGERVLQLTDAHVGMSDLVIRGGATAEVGGGIYSTGGAIALTRIELYDNTAVSGGGLYSEGDAALRLTNITFNSADLIGGGIYQGAGTLLTEDTLVYANTASNGAGLYGFDASLLIHDGTHFSDNAATSDGGGISTDGTAMLSVRDAQFTGNTSQGSGGAIHGGSSEDLRIERSDFTGNEATADGGAIHGETDVFIEDGLVSGNTAGGQGGGAWGTWVYIQRTRFENNDAGDNGGAVKGHITCEASDATLSGNTAKNGGAFYCQKVYLTGVRVLDNEATERGGGAYAWTDASIADSTFATNFAADAGGGLALEAGNTTFVRRSLLRENSAGNDGGGIFVAEGDEPVELSNTTISGNAAVFGTGSGLYIAENAEVHAVNVTLANNTPGENVAKYGDLTLQNSIITTPGGIDCVAALDNPAINSLGGNLSDDDTCVGLDFADDITEVDVLLAPLAANGGNTMTHALLAGSPALDRGNVSACAAAPVDGVDQRGGARNVGLQCDIGAHEQGAAVSFALFGDGFE